MPPKVQKVMVQPINLIFRYLQNRSRVQVWLYENTKLRMEGIIIGFDEYMNLVLDEASEVIMKTDEKKSVGKVPFYSPSSSSPSGVWLLFLLSVSLI